MYMKSCIQVNKVISYSIDINFLFFNISRILFGSHSSYSIHMISSDIIREELCVFLVSFSYLYKGKK